MMKKNVKRTMKVLSLLLALATVFSVVALPSGFLASALSELSFPLWNDFSEELEGVRIPFSPENPYSPEVTVGELYPVFTSEWLRYYEENDRVNSYDTHIHTVQGASRWYTASIAPWFDYVTEDAAAVEGTLPYREERERMLHGDLTLLNGEMRVELTGTPYFKDSPDGFRVPLDLDHLKRLGLSAKQLSLRARARLLSGKGSIRGAAGVSGYLDSGTANPDPEESTYLSVDLPVYDACDGAYVDFRASSATGDAAMTDMGLFLVDDTSPSITYLHLVREEKEDGTAELLVRLYFNEQIRFANGKIDGELNDIWIELLLRDNETGVPSTARLYLSEVENGRSLYFRGDIGEYNYKNYTIERISGASFAENYYYLDRAFIDLADNLYESPYKTLDYNNEILILDDWKRTYTTAICDVAGNPIKVEELVNWRFHDHTYNANSFDAGRVEVYNEYTLGRAEGRLSGKANEYEMIAGPDNELTVFVYLNAHLSEEDARKISIELNVKNPDGTPVTARVTSVSEYRTDEVYGGVRAGTLLKFENIPLSRGMTYDGATGEGAEPRIQAVRMTDEIEDKTAFQRLPESASIIYADLDAPTASLSLFAQNTHTGEDGRPTHYTVSIKAEAQDPTVYKYKAGLLDTYATLSLGLSSGEAVDVRYAFKYGEGAALPPESAEGYTESATLTDTGLVPMGEFKIIGDPAACYLHLYIPTKQISTEGFVASLHATDKAGNENAGETATLAYLIDERAPTVTLGAFGAEANETNDRIRAALEISATDPSEVQRIEYLVGELTPDAVWSPLAATLGTTATARWEATYGGFSPDTNRVYEQTLWIRATDAFGNVSEPISRAMTLSLQKPVISATPVTDPNAVSTAHEFLVTGADAALLGGATAYTRVMLVPEGDAYAYVTLVPTGVTRNLFSFENSTWYRVRTEGNLFAEVSEAITLGETPTLDAAHPLYGLLSHYGEVRISLDAGYGDMIPVAGERFFDAPDAGSYIADENAYTVRFASPYLRDVAVHALDFGALTDRTGEVVMGDTDAGAAPYVFGAEKRTVNPMRNATFAYTLSNAARADFGLLDLDTEGSYAELLWVSHDGASPVTVARVQGLTPTETQYFTVKNLTDGGEYFSTGAYFLRVTVKSRSGHTQFFDSAYAIVDASVADNAGVWRYDYWTIGSPYALYEHHYDGSYELWTQVAEDAPYSSFGVSVLETDGERMRSGVFAVYSFGAEALWVNLSNPDSLHTLMGVEVGRTVGYQIWNLASEPSEEELERAPFHLNTPYVPDGESVPDGELTVVNGLEEIYTEETVPKGYDAIGKLHLIAGVNTICYRVKMANGYISPVRQFTLNVTSHAPELNVAVEDYVPSAVVSQREGTVNAHSVRFFIESAYTLNGDGVADVQLWSRYGMNVGRTVDGERVESFLADPTGNDDTMLGVLATSLEAEDFADFTENSYTADFPDFSSICSAIFVALDDYGGVTFVAPQLGDHSRVKVSGAEANEREYRIEYDGDYYNNPYDISDGEYRVPWRIRYNEPTYFGRDLLALTTYLEYDNEPYEVLEISRSELEYNLFNIVTNDVSFAVDMAADVQNTLVRFAGSGKNLHLINPADAYVTLTGDDIGEVTLALSGEDNAVGYMGASWTEDRFSLSVAHPTADAEHAAGTTVERGVRIHGTNRTGQSFLCETTLTLTYREPTVTVGMTESGAYVTLGVQSVEHGGGWQTGIYENGTYPTTFTDLYGGVHETTFAVTDDKDPAVRVTTSNPAPTVHPVTLTLSSVEAITVNVTDYGLMRVTGNGSREVTVVLTGNTRFSYSYTDSEGNHCVKYLTVDQIRTPAPYAVYSAGSDSYRTDEESGVAYRYGEVTVWLTDAAMTLVDRYTGKTPSFTFTPGGATEYVFSAEALEGILGEERVVLTEDVKVSIPYELREPLDPMEGAINDTETPNLRVRAYANVGGVYSDRRVTLTLASANVTRAFGSLGASYYDYRYVGARANAFELLGAIGWGTDYRFALDVADSSRVRLFVKEGLYNTVAPDFETGVSDEIAGVSLHSRLLTVSENAQFTLFAVDARGNVSQIAFDVTSLSDAPVATAVKVPVGHGTVRVYVLPPVEAGADFEILGYDAVMTDNDPESPRYGCLYVELHENDDFIINYAYEYQGERVSGALPIRVSEISLDEMAEVGREYSANASDEWTAQDVTATVYFSHAIERAVLDSAEALDVTVLTSGNVLTVTYHDNAPEATLTLTAVNGTTTRVKLSAIKNIDRSVPVITEVERVLAPDGKSITVTLRTDDRTVAADTGAAGEEKADGFYYTRRFTANGDYVLRFASAAGLIGEITLTVSELVLDPLTAEYSLSSDGTDAVTDPANLALSIGDTFYVRPVRDVTATLSDGTEKAWRAGVWSAIKVAASLGQTQPYIVMSDAWGNVLVHQLSQILVPDTTGPEILLGRRTWSVRVGTDRETIVAELMANAALFDNEGGEIACRVELPEDLSSVGVYEILYVATDAAGNETRQSARLRVTSVYEPVMHLGETKINRDDGVYVKAGEETVFSVDCAGISWRAVMDAGIRTAAQMKDDVTLVCDYNAGSTLNLGVLEAGTYTLCIVTQERDFFRILISVE